MVRPPGLFSEDPEPQDLLFFEKMYWDQGFFPVAGTDEAGRGCLAGPVVAAAVILPKDVHLPDVTDSKVLRPEQRESLYCLIQEKCLAWAISEVSAREIDQTNILQASLKAMVKAVEKLAPRPALLLVDGNQPIPSKIIQKTIIKGDSRSLSIAAASILAKVYRDRLMAALHEEYPRYGFDKHKGYATKLHKEALRENGPSPCHRTTFKGVKELLHGEKRQ